MQRTIVFFLLVAVVLMLTGCTQNPGTPGPAPAPTPASNATVPANGTPAVIITGQQNHTVVVPGQNVQPVQNGTATLNVGYTSTPNADVAVYFINVGTPDKQGDAILVKKGDLDILVDAGPAERGDAVRSFLKERGVDDIDVFVSTHADTEHYGGLRNVLQDFRVEETWWPNQTFGDSDYVSLLAYLQQQDTPLRSVQRGDTFDINGMHIQVLNPRVVERFQDADNNAIVLRITDRQFCILLTSDIQAGVEGDLANMNDVECILMQAPFHGLGRGSAQLDLAMLHVDPEAMIFSGGPNDQTYGERQPLLNRLNLRNIAYYENYRNGTVRVVSNGVDYDIGYFVSTPLQPRE